MQLPSLRYLFELAVLSAALATTGFTTAQAADVDDAAQARVQQFWKRLSAGEAAQLKDFYAPEVTLKTGSELLKPQWSVVPNADRQKDTQVPRKDLLAGYAAMIEKIGKEKWAAIFAKFGPDNLRIAQAKQRDLPFAGIQAGDILLAIDTGDSPLQFVFRKGADGDLLIHMEATDY